MTAKDKILEAWIMVEHLSEGDISINDQSVLTLENLQGQDFHSLFLNEMKKRSWIRVRRVGLLYILISSAFRKQCPFFGSNIA